MDTELEYLKPAYKNRRYYKRIAPSSDGAILVYGGLVQSPTSDNTYVDLYFCIETKFFGGYITESSQADTLLRRNEFKELTLKEYLYLHKVCSE